MPYQAPTKPATRKHHGTTPPPMEYVTPPILPLRRNILCGPTMNSGLTQDKCGEWWSYVSPRPGNPGAFTVAAGGDSLTDQFILTGSDAEFELRMISVGISQNFAFRLRDSMQRPICADWTLAQELMAPVFPTRIIPPGGKIYVDILSTGSDLSTQLCLIGRKIHGHGRPGIPGYVELPYFPMWARYSQAPCGFRDFQYDYFFTGPNGTINIDVPAGKQEDYLINLDDDADHYIRAIQINPVNSNAGVCKFVLYDAFNHGLSASGFNGVPTGETIPLDPYVLSNNMFGTTDIGPRPLWAEMYCPPASVIRLSAIELTGTDAGQYSVMLRCVKRLGVEQ